MALAAGQKIRAQNLGSRDMWAAYLCSGSQSIPDATDTKVAFDTALVTSPYVTRSASAPGHLFTFLKSGIWAITTTCRFGGTASTGERGMHLEDSLGIWMCATAGTPSSHAGETMSLHIVRYFTANDFVSVELTQNRGSPLSTETDALKALGRIDIVGILLDD
jgi:hypothetical protein